MAIDGTTLIFKFFYFMTKINGLLPISITFEPLEASYSLNDVLYSTMYTVLVIVFTPFVQSIVIESVGIIHNPKLTIILVFLAQVIASASRLVAIYVSQVFNYKNLSNFVNRSVQIHGMFNEEIRQKKFLDHKLSKWCWYKCVSTILQVILMLVPSAGFVFMIKSSERFFILLTSFLFILYTHMVLILSTGIYFAGMLVIGQLFRNLNRQVSSLQSKTERRAQELCNLSDECDELIALYKTIASHATDFIKYQRCFIIFSLTQYFVILLAEVLMNQNLRSRARLRDQKTHFVSSIITRSDCMYRYWIRY